MIRAAGIFFLCGDTALFLRRGNGADHPNEWAFPGGKLEDGEGPEQAAIRETIEEAGVTVEPKALRPWIRTIAKAEAGLPAIEGQTPAPSEDVDFTTYLVRVKQQFTPKLNLNEHDGYSWAPVGGAPEPLHPGVRTALERLTMDELGVARAMADGRLASPQQYENVWLFAIRITGTGAAYRVDREEFVWRDPSIYLNDEFLARCNGLQVIWEHPDENLLNSKEFQARTVGSVFLPYLRADKPDEVWAIAKIYDAQAVKGLLNDELSTSPAVNFSNSSINEKVTLESGKTILIEGKPSLLDHIAICSNGVWDKLGEPTGVESADTLADSQPIFIIRRRNLDKMKLLRTQTAALALQAQVRASI